MVITPTLSYASGTWTPSREHERLIRSTQRKMLHLIVQTRKYHKTTQPSMNEKDEEGEKENHRSSDGETAINFFHIGLKFCFLPAILMSSTFSHKNNRCSPWPASGRPYNFRSRGTTGSSMVDHDFGHLRRGRRFHNYIWTFLVLDFFTNFGASSIFT